VPLEAVVSLLIRPLRKTAVAVGAAVLAAATAPTIRPVAEETVEMVALVAEVGAAALATVVAFVSQAMAEMVVLEEVAARVVR
jgi:hypothetical protein